MSVEISEKANEIMNPISAFLWGYRNWESAHHSLRKFKQFYPDGDVFIQIDIDGDYSNYKKVADEFKCYIDKSSFKIGYPGDFGDKIIGRKCWPKENAIEWCNQIYNTCLKAKTKFIIVLEEDGFVLKPISILKEEFGIAVMEYNSNVLPEVLLDVIKQVGGNTDIPLAKWGKGYGASGAFIIDREKWIESWEYFKPILELNYEMIESYSHLIGWPDCLAQLVVMAGNHKVVINTQWAQAWWHERPDLYPNYTHWSNYEIVDYLKDIETIRTL